jgi:hypothetical protein
MYLFLRVMIREISTETKSGISIPEGYEML